MKYTEYVRRYKRVRDIVDGEYRLKQVDLGNLDSVTNGNIKGQPNTGYLRYINPDDRSRYNIARNRGYINGSRLFNATTRTLSGLMGMLFKVNPKWPDFPLRLQYLVDNANGGGLGLTQQAQSVAWNVLQIGRHGLLCDMPRNEEGVEITQGMVDGGFRPSILEYTAENIIDYNESIINGVNKLDLLVLREFKTVFADNRIDREDEAYLRVYRLTDVGVTVQLYDGKDGIGEELGREIVVTGGGGARLSEIPFVFVGSVNNSTDYDLLPLEPLTDVNIGHYQESANLRSSSYQLSAAQLVVSDDNYQRSLNNKGVTEIETGEDSALVLGTGGNATFISPSANSLSSELMANDEERMVALGAQLITGGGQAETAEAARIKHASDVSILENVSCNISRAYNDMFKYCSIFMSITDELDDASLNKDFYDSKLTAQEIDAIIRAWQSGAISKPVLDQKLQDGKVISDSVDLEEMNESIDEELGGDLSGLDTTSQEQ